MNHFTPTGSYDTVKQESNRHLHVGEEQLRPRAPFLGRRSLGEWERRSTLQIWVLRTLRVLQPSPQAL